MDKIGPYQIVETLKRGAQSLYRAKAKDGHEVALKAVPVDGLSPESRERFTREAETCRALDHPNVTRVFEMGEADGMLYQAMELLVGADLGKVMADGRHFTWEEKLSIMEQACEGLQYAHDRHLVHRDIKPANLFLEDSGRLRVLDFGMVRVAESELTKVGSALGTLNYMAPEQIRGERCTASSDVFSAGIVFFQLATGRHPFSARDRSLAQIVSAIVFETQPKLTELAPDAPEGLEFILNRALEKDPAKRWQNAGELKQALALCRVTLKLGVAPDPGPAASSSAGGQRQEAAPVLEGEKTKVLARPQVAVVAAEDGEKTKVLRRPEVAAPVARDRQAEPPAPQSQRQNIGQAEAPAPPKSVPAPAPAAAPVAAKSAMAWRYCPSCTTRNAPDAASCVKCGNPLGGAKAERVQSKPVGLYVAIAAAVLLGLALIAVLIFK